MTTATIETARAADLRRTMRPATGDVRVAPEGGVVARTGRAWVLGTIGFVVFWSLTYLLRQPGIEVGAAPFSLIGDFALEGAVLALSWLTLLVCACLAVLRGTIVIRTDG